jgi:hypothetical protein
MSAVVIASTLVRGLANRRESGSERAAGEGQEHAATVLKVSLEPGN